MKMTGYFVAVISMITLGCSSSRITSSWKVENAVPQKYNKIMVLGLIRETDRAVQEKMENHLVGDLKGLGYNAISCFREYGPGAFDKMEEDAAIAKLKTSGVEAVLTIVMLDKQKESRYVPGNIYYSPYGYYYNRFWGYRTTLYQRIYEPGYYLNSTKYFWESNLYDMDSQKLIYSVQTESFDPASTEILGHEYGQLIINDMLKKNVVMK